MNRLTFKINDAYYAKEPSYLYEDTYKLIQCLGKYEDLEEELGIDFKTLFQVIKEDKIYFKFGKEIQCWSPIKIELRKKNIYFCRQCGGHYASRQPLSNYGKSWALTREELEDD